MSKKILLIENDSALAGALTESLEASGFDVRVAAEGKSGLDLAREWMPDGIVLCVELPGMSGYLVCQKLRKDEATKDVPLVLVSAEATQDTFDKHKALKVRADAYLLKPFVPGDLLQKLAEIGLGAQLGEMPQTTDEISLQPADGLELDAGPGAPALVLDPLADEPAPEAAPASPTGSDDDLAFLDEAFDGLAAPARALEPAQEDDLAAGPAAFDPGELDGGDAGGAALALDEDDPLAQLRDDPPAPVRAPSADVLRAAGIPLLDEPPSRGASRPTLAGVPAAALRTPAPPAPRADTAERDAELSSLRSRVEALTAQTRKSETELKAARDEARRATSELESLRAKLADAERRASEAASATARIDDLERELESARTEVIVARGEAEGARGEVDSRTAELAKRLADLEAQSAKNEERVFKAYQKIKGDEKVKDKVRKALAIAAQLLDEGLPAEPAAPEKSSKVS